jgi:organizing structure protein 2
VDAPSVLETQIGEAREAATGVARNVHARVHEAVSKWIGVRFISVSVLTPPIPILK